MKAEPLVEETGDVWQKYRIQSVAIIRIIFATGAITKKLHNRIQILQIHSLVELMTYDAKKAFTHYQLYTLCLFRIIYEIRLTDSNDPFVTTRLSHYLHLFRCKNALTH